MSSYTYGDSAHPDAATSIGTAYTSAYDAVGDMVCRAPTASTTCAGSPTGASLGYDNEGRLATWQNAPSSPTTTDSFLYDDEGNRIEQVVQQSGVGETDTVYVGGLEEVTTTTPTGGQPTTSVTAYYGNALSVNGTLSFLASDNLGSAEEALNTGGQVTASQLYTPYGDSRYSSGTFPTDQGFTGYLADTVTGLDDANARYYDPAAGQFSSADTTLQGGLNRYAYVGGNPTSHIDPSGHLEEVDFKESGGGNGAGGGGLVGLLCLFGGCEAAGGVAADEAMTITSNEGDGITLVSQDDATTGTETDWYENSQGDTVQEVDGQWVAEDDSEQTQEGEAEKNAEADQAQERNAEADAQKTTNETNNNSNGSGEGSGSGDGSGNGDGGNGPVKTTQNFYRSGNTTSPTLDNLREGKEYPVGSDMVPANGGTDGYGPSLYGGDGPSDLSAKQAARIWVLPAGSDVPDGYSVASYPTDGAIPGFNGADHYIVVSDEEVPVVGMKGAMSTFNGSFIPFNQFNSGGN